jgi:hypothetical protein
MKFYHNEKKIHRRRSINRSWLFICSSFARHLLVIKILLVICSRGLRLATNRQDSPRRKEEKRHTGQYISYLSKPQFTFFKNIMIKPSLTVSIRTRTIVLVLTVIVTALMLQLPMVQCSNLVYEETNLRASSDNYAKLTVNCLNGPKTLSGRMSTVNDVVTISVCCTETSGSSHGYRVLSKDGGTKIAVVARTFSAADCGGGSSILVTTGEASEVSGTVGWTMYTAKVMT